MVRWEDSGYFNYQALLKEEVHYSELRLPTHKQCVLCCKIFIFQKHAMIELQLDFLACADFTLYACFFLAENHLKCFGDEEFK